MTHVILNVFLITDHYLFVIALDWDQSTKSRVGGMFVSCGHKYFSRRHSKNFATPPQLFALVCEYTSDRHKYQKMPSSWRFSLLCPYSDASLSHSLETHGFPTFASLTAFLHGKTRVFPTPFLFDSE